MNHKLSTAEQRLLWMLVASGGEGYNSDLKTDKTPRDSLQRARLIEVTKIAGRTSNRKVMHLKLEDAGWAWCNGDMSWQKPKGKAERFLDSLLQRLKVIFERGECVASLADFLEKSKTVAGPAEAQTKPAVSIPPAPVETLEDRIRVACLELGGGREAVRVRLADLRKRLAEVPHDDLTRGVLELSRLRELTLYPLDDPRQITPADVEAAIQSSTGVHQHILYLGGIAS